MIKNRKQIRIGRQTISYTHIQTGSPKICFMLSGSGYNYDKPLFYYSNMMMLQNSIDVVHVHYSYDDTFSKKSMDEITEIMMEDVNPVILEVLSNVFYKDVIFLGKSIGTIPIANDLMKRAEFLNSTIILLTPLLNFEDIFNSIRLSPHHGLLVLGDQDTHFNPSFLPKLNSTNLNIEIIPNANHSLDIEASNTMDSVVALSKVMQRIQEVIT